MNTETPNKEKETKRRTGGEDIPQTKKVDVKEKEQKRPDFARGMHDEDLAEETPDYARGLREGSEEEAEPANDFAKGLREGEKNRTVRPDFARVEEEEEDDS